MMLKNIVLVSAMVLVGCDNESDDVDIQSDALIEIVENLELAGYPATEIEITDNGSVIVGGDAVVSLEASREMIGLEGHVGGYGDDRFRQYRTTNQVGAGIDVICLNGAAYKGTMSTGLDNAIARYNDLDLQFSLLRTSSANAPGCDATITMQAKGFPGGMSGFPSGGLPYGQVQVGKSTVNYGVDVVTHIIAHEIGHCIGLRHTDYFDRSISCGGAASNEGNDGVGAIHISGTPTGAVLDGSVMNSCWHAGSTGEWTASDIAALTTLY